MAAPAADSIGAIASDFWEWHLQEHPEEATSLGDHRYDDRLTDLSAPAHARRAEAARALARRLDALGELTGEDAVTADVLRLELAEIIDSERFHLEQVAVDHMDGLQVAFPRWIAGHPTRDERDLATLVARYVAFPSQMQEYMANLGEGLAARRTAPRILVERVIAQLRERLTQDAGRSSFVHGRFPDKKVELTAVVTRNIYPAYRALMEFLQAEYLPRCRSNVGLWALPEGADIYAFTVRQRTGSHLTPAQLHDLGERELTRVDAELRALAGHPVRRALEQWLQADPRFTDRDAQLEAYRRTVDRFRQRLSEEFSALPTHPLRVEAMPEAMEQHVPRLPLRAPLRGRLAAGDALREHVPGRHPAPLPDGVAGGARGAARPPPADLDRAGTDRPAAPRGGARCSPPSPRAGRCTPSGWRGRWASTRTTAPGWAWCWRRPSAPSVW